MKIPILSIIIASLSLSSLRSQAQETPEEIVKRLAELGPGVHEIKVENGRLKSLKVVGQDRISTVLGAAKGLPTAQKRASMKANAAFVEWMKNHVASISVTNDETIVTMQGDGKNVTEQGKSSEQTKEIITQKAEGLVRGLTLVAKDQKEDNLTLVYSWSPERAALAKDAQEQNQNPGTATSPANKKIPSKTVVSPDFDK